MEEVVNQNSALRTPLDDILGSRGHILALRQLVELEGPTSPSELLKRTGLSRQGVYDVVGRLFESGILTYIGSGQRQLVKLRVDHPLSQAITELFASERKRYERLISRLHEEMKRLVHKPTSAWIFGKAAKGMDEYGDPLQIAVLGELKTIESQTDKLKDRIYQSGIEAEFDVTIDLRGVTVADLEFRSELTEDQIILLWGIEPKQFLKASSETSNGNHTHQDLDARSLADAKAWTQLLKRYPEIIPKTVKYLDSRIPKISSGEKKELQEWKHLLESMSLQRLQKFLLSDSERSVRLRQSLPFWQVLNENERADFHKLKSKQSEADE